MHSNSSAEHSPASPSLQGTDRPNVYFNVLRRLPNVNLMHKWAWGDRPVQPLPVQTVSLPRGEYTLTPVIELNMEKFSPAEQMFIECVRELGIWVVGEGASPYGWPEALIPGIVNWPLDHTHINSIDWRPQ